MGVRGSPKVAIVALLALVLLSAGCLVGQGEGDEASTAAEGDKAAASQPADPAPATHTLEIVAWDVSEIRDVLSVEDVAVSPTPASMESFQLGPAESEDPTVVLARFNVTEGQTLERFQLKLTVDDGLGPAELTLEIPPWTAREDARVNVHLELEEVGAVAIDHADGDLVVDVPAGDAEPRYGYLQWPSGTRQPLDGLDRIVHVPQAYPRFGPGSQPVFHADGEVAWFLDGQLAGQGTEADLAPGPGRHDLVLKDPDSDREAELTFSINQRFGFQGTVQAGSLEHRDSLAGVNEDTYNVSVSEGARTLFARLEPVGNHSEAENLDLYALNETGGVIDQSATNDTREIMRLSRGDLADVDNVQLRVHGEKALASEYKLTGTVFYRPW